MRPLGIGSRGRFLFVTIYETRNGLLLIEVFSKLLTHKIMATRICSLVAVVLVFEYYDD